MIMQVTPDECAMLSDLGYRPGYVLDIVEGDEVAIPPVSRYLPGNEGLRMVRVERIFAPIRGNTQVLAFIGTSSDGANHYSYGAAYPVWIKRAESKEGT
jgi:hypothetical protein